MKNILVVDDDNSSLKVAQQLLSGNYKVITVNSGEKALEYLKTKHADLILLDIYMPEMNGIDFLKIINHKEDYSKIPIIVLTADTNASTEIGCFKLGATDYIEKPFVPEVMLSRIERILELQEYRDNLEVCVKKQTEKITHLQNEVIIAMANLIESRDGSTGEHVKRTTKYVELMLNELKERGLYTKDLSAKYIRHLCKAAPLHDIGKIKVPDVILNKPAKLTEEEFNTMKCHVVEGGAIIMNTMGKIEDIEYIELAYNVALYHHEKWDGNGYPKRLKAEEIPLCARIMAIADVFDALVSRRCYKEPIPVEIAFDIIKESGGTHFDPCITEVFLELKPKIIRILNEDKD